MPKVGIPWHFLLRLISDNPLYSKYFRYPGPSRIFYMISHLSTATSQSAKKFPMLHSPAQHQASVMPKYCSTLLWVVSSFIIYATIGRLVIPFSQYPSSVETVRIQFTPTKYSLDGSIILPLTVQNILFGVAIIDHEVSCRRLTRNTSTDTDKTHTCNVAKDNIPYSYIVQKRSTVAPCRYKSIFTGVFPASSRSIFHGKPAGIYTADGNFCCIFDLNAKGKIQSYLSDIKSQKTTASIFQI